MKSYGIYIFVVSMYFVCSQQNSLYNNCSSKTFNKNNNNNNAQYT